MPDLRGSVVIRHKISTLKFKAGLDGLGVRKSGGMRDTLACGMFPGYYCVPS